MPIPPTHGFLIVDASGLLYRSFYAVKGLSSQNGEPTGALYGFVRSVLKAVADVQPSALAIVFDGPNNKASRLSIYPEYKAHRKPMPPELLAQLPESVAFCRLAGLPFLQIPGVEADDVIASITEKVLQTLDPGKPVVILSADKDLMQLVQQRVLIVNPMKEYALYGVEEVVHEWEIAPEQIRDFLAIVGDSSDNVPGIDGLGAKAAAKLLQERGSLDEIYAHIDELSPSVQAKLRAGKESAFMSRQLVSLDRSVDIPENREWYQYSEEIASKLQSGPLIDFYREKGFKSLIPKTNAPRLASAPVSIVGNRTQLDSFFDWLQIQSGPIAIDVETSSLDEHTAELVGIGIGASIEQIFYIDFAHSDLDPRAVTARISDLFSKKNISIIGHNIKYDLHILSRYGLALPAIAADTLVASWLLDPEERRHSLDDLALRIFEKEKIPIESLIGAKKPLRTMREVPQADVAAYCGEDVEYTLRLYSYFKTRLHDNPALENLFYNVEMPLLPILFHMEQRGIFFNSSKIDTLRSSVELLLEKSKEAIFALSGESFNLNSPKQLADILYNKMSIPPVKKGKKALSTDIEALEELSLDWPIASLIIEYRQLEKLRSTYIDALPSFISPTTHRLHCRFTQSGTATGRLACHDPNLQNIPVRSELGKMIRAAFEPADPSWSFVSFDYSQIELRILAHMSEDPTLLYAFHHDLDVHSITAQEIFHVPADGVTPEMRHRAKAVNFGVIYGQKGFGLSRELHIPVSEANAFIDAYFRKYPFVQKTVEELKRRAFDRGFAETITGRIRPLKDIRSSNAQVRSAQERLAVNAPFQGTAADIIKIAMIEVEKRIAGSGLKAQMLLQIHDELLFEAPDYELETLCALVRDAMEHVLSLKVPLKVDVAIGKNWKEC